MVVDITQIKKTEELAKKLAKEAQKGDVFALNGELGTGKTTFTQFFLKELGVDETVKSPTFILQREYKIPALGTTAFHIDLYRANSSTIIFDLELQVPNLQNQLTIIEWPELVKDILPSNTKWLHFKLEDDKRTVKIK